VLVSIILQLCANYQAFLGVVDAVGAATLEPVFGGRGRSALCGAQGAVLNALSEVATAARGNKGDAVVRRSVLLLALMAEAMPAVSSPAVAAPDPNRVYVESIPTLGGSGCPQGTAGATISALVTTSQRF